MADDGFHVDRTADPVDVGAHDIHADAAPRQARHLRRGGESLREDELMDLRLGHLVDVGLGGEPGGHGLGRNATRVEAAAVVADLDDDVPPLVIGG